MIYKHNSLRKIALVILMIAVAIPAFFFGQPKKADAQVSCLMSMLGMTGIASMIGDIMAVPVRSVSITTNTGLTSAATTGNNISECIIKPMVKGIIKSLLHNFTNSVVDWINSGFHGSPSFVSNPEGFFANVGDIAAGQFLEGLGPIGQILCSPFDLQLRIALGLSAGGGRRFEYYGCRLTDVQKNIYNAFTGGQWGSNGWSNWIAVTQPQNNAYGAYLYAQDEMSRRIANKVGLRQQELNWGSGFLGNETCYDETGAEISDSQLSAAEMNGENIRCQTNTPGSVIQTQLNKALGSEQDFLQVADDFNAIVGALVNQAINQVFSATGLLGTNKGSSYYGGRSYLQSTVQSYQSQLASAQVLPPAGVNCSNTYRVRTQTTLDVPNSTDSHLSQFFKVLPSGTGASSPVAGGTNSTSAGAKFEIPFPSAGASLIQGTTYNINWNNTDSGVTSYAVYLIKTIDTAGKQERRYLGNASASAHSFRWTVPTDSWTSSVTANPTVLNPFWIQFIGNEGGTISRVVAEEYNSTNGFYTLSLTSPVTFTDLTKTPFEYQNQIKLGCQNLAMSSSASQAISGLVSTPGLGLTPTGDSGTTATPDSNIAVGRSASQSSTYGALMTPDKAIDGVTAQLAWTLKGVGSGGIGGGGCGYDCGAQTEEDKPAWWEVDLGADYNIHQIKIYQPAGDAWRRMSLFESPAYPIFISILNSSGNPVPVTGTTNVGISFSSPVNQISINYDSNGSKKPIEINGLNVKGRKIRIERGSSVNASLALAEVQVYGTLVTGGSSGSGTASGPTHSDIQITSTDPSGAGGGTAIILSTTPTQSSSFDNNGNLTVSSDATMKDITAKINLYRVTNSGAETTIDLDGNGAVDNDGLPRMFSNFKIYRSFDPNESTPANLEQLYADAPSWQTLTQNGLPILKPSNNKTLYYLKIVGTFFTPASFFSDSNKSLIGKTYKLVVELFETVSKLPVGTQTYTFTIKSPYAP